MYNFFTYKDFKQLVIIDKQHNVISHALMHDSQALAISNQANQMIMERKEQLLKLLLDDNFYDKVNKLITEDK